MSDDNRTLICNDIPGITVQAKIPVNIVLEGIGKLNPKDDITPLEAARLTMIMAVAASNWFGLIDHEAFIKQHGLERHFDAVE